MSIDHKQQSQSRVYAQYSDKPKAFEWCGINGDLANELEIAFESVADSYNIDDAGTDELNTLGVIVDISRSFEGQVEYDTFQFGSSQFGGSITQFRPLAGVTDQELNNDIYRLLIKAKIAKNNSDSTIDDIILSLREIVSTNDITIEDPEDMSFAVVFGSLNKIEKLVITNFNIVPKPQGVRFAGFEDKGSVTEFGSAQFGRSQFAYRFGV